jgi:hypothetical protein
MTYGIKRYGTWRTRYWRADEVKDSREIFSKNGEEYADLDVTLFKEILKEELDVPDYAVTEKNIKKEFGYEENGLEIKPECLKRIVEYYKWRKALFKKICKQTLDNRAEALLKQIGSDEIKFRYYIPAEYNNFSCEDPAYTGGQTEAYLEIALYR